MTDCDQCMDAARFQQKQQKSTGQYLYLFVGSSSFISLKTSTFLSRIVTSDEKWCLYVSVKTRKEWLSSNREATPRAKLVPTRINRCASNGTKKTQCAMSCFRALKFLTSIPPDFFRRDIEKLPGRWKATKSNGGECLLDQLMYSSYQNFEVTQYLLCFHFPEISCIYGQKCNRKEETLETYL